MHPLRTFAHPLAALLAAAPLAAGAQTLAPKEAPPPPSAAAACPRATPPATSASGREQAQRLLAQAHEAIVAGDLSSARTALRRASELDPSDDDIAYQYARALEESGAPAEAAREYCRFLSLAPNAPQAAAVRARLAKSGNLTPPPDTATQFFVSGLTHLRAEDWAVAHAAFDSVIARRPELPDAYYDRALASVGAGDRDGAVSDFESYLRLRPEADDRAQVTDAIAGLRAHALSPTGALVRGLIVPGLGQMYTHRPIIGLAILAGAAGAIVWAQQSHTGTEVRTFKDPFGFDHSYTVQVTQHPHLVAGLATAGALATIGAIEAWGYAKRRGGNASTGAIAVRTSYVTPVVVPGVTGVTYGVAVRLAIR